MTFLPEQMLRAVLLAIEVNRPDKEIYFDRYLAYASKFEEGQKESIDVMRKAITHFYSGL